ncbi:LysR family transcriptional regulator [Erwiniaceae bacterium BAC15a-03b]|uniref:LysR family transcriptional regulator n=1 Tax=Winslowiella arboricola TaxID=2978220 RepID=A0A9J6PQY6_9GAMM|nr:LysR family transcriptional regulator [Winslowiella arboricola]MCU5774513.1 LysR family transcriptional regulator [Winslowiella arboricola]MCU5778077.1 LysR family transcriptional regulator [Winslowiella arboricola]
MKIDADITFRKLEIFIAFMANGNIARTAEALGLSSVSVHRALHTLEESVRCPLFMHKGRNLLPLPAAHTLLAHSVDAVEVMACGIDEARKAAGVGQGRMRVGTLYSLTLETVPRLIMGMKLRRPELELELMMGSNQMLLNKLEEGQLDAILLSVTDSQIDTHRHQVLPLFEDDIFLAAPASSALNISGEADLRDFRQQKFVSLAEGFATYHGFQEAFHVAGFEPDIVMRVNDIFSMLSLVQAGVGFTLVPGRMKKVYENSLQLMKLAEPYQMRQTIAIVFNRNREYDPNILALTAEGRMYSRDTAFSAAPAPAAPV